MTEEAEIVIDTDVFEKDIMNEINSKPKERKIPKSTFEFYYQSIFPYKYFFKWLANEKTDVFERREFTFTLEGDIYVRFLCFKNEIEMRSELLKAIPIKIDIGAIYNTLPKYHNSVMDSNTNVKTFTPVQKEMVFDIDMTDYDDVRTCCKDARICDKCWSFMIIAYRILKEVLEEDFGFKHNLWVFSGRRGIHCWVSDERARKLSNDARSAVANYIKIKAANAKTGNLFVLRDNIHPSHERAIRIIEEYFDEKIVKEQRIFENENIKEIIVMYIKEHFRHKNNINEFESKVRTLMKADYDEYGIGIHLKIWEELNVLLDTYENEVKISNKYKPKYSKTDLCLKNIKLTLSYPRLDINVSKHLNHLLKAPFCIHPKTGLISVPLTGHDILNFKLENIPDVDETLDNLNQNKKTKFSYFYDNFKKFVDNLNNSK